MSKRLGTNARIQLESQRQFNKQKRGKTLQAVSSYWKWVLTICLIFTTSAVIGYGINRSTWMQEYKAEKNKYKVEWASIADQLWSEWQVENQSESKVIAAVKKEDKWFEMHNNGELKPWQGPLYSLPVIQLDKTIGLEDVAKFLESLQMNYPRLYENVSEINLKENEMIVYVVGVEPKVLLRMDRQPDKLLSTVEKFVKKFPAEVYNAKTLDARFPGFIYASKDDK